MSRARDVTCPNPKGGGRGIQGICKNRGGGSLISRLGLERENLCKSEMLFCLRQGCESGPTRWCGPAREYQKLRCHAAPVACLWKFVGVVFTFLHRFFMDSNSEWLKKKPLPGNIMVLLCKTSFVQPGVIHELSPHHCHYTGWCVFICVYVNVCQLKSFCRMVFCCKINALPHCMA